MITYRLSGSDLAMSRFGVSTLNEVTLSLRALWRPGVYPHMQRWRRAVEPSLRRLDLEVLLALVAADYSTPDFLNPRPYSPMTEIGEDLRLAAQVSERTVERDLDAIHPTGRPAALTGRTARVRERILRALESYWHTCVRPHWPRMAATLRADIAHRGWALAQRGTVRTIGDLSRSLSLQGTVLTAFNPSGPEYRADARGRGIVFVPTLFTPWVSYPFAASEPPYLLYPARGRGRLGESVVVAPEQLVDLLGLARATLLCELDAPASSSDLAALRGVTVSAANQHLRRLLALGLVEDHRHGRVVLYSRSARARALIDLFPAV